MHDTIPEPEYHLYYTSEADVDTLQAASLGAIHRLAQLHHFATIQTQYFYLFDERAAGQCYSLECDVLDCTATRMAVECYVYEQHRNNFIAKTFVVYSR